MSKKEQEVYVSFVPLQPGKIEISLKISNEDIEGSPVVFEIVEPSAHTSSSTNS